MKKSNLAAAPKLSQAKLAKAQAGKLASAAKKDNWSASKVARHSGLFSFADAKNIHILSCPSSEALASKSPPFDWFTSDELRKVLRTLGSKDFESVVLIGGQSISFLGAVLRHSLAEEELMPRIAVLPANQRRDPVNSIELTAPKSLASTLEPKQKLAISQLLPALRCRCDDNRLAKLEQS